MALDKLVDSSALDSGLTLIGNAIRYADGTSGTLLFPSGMAESIRALKPTGTKTITDDGTTNVAGYEFAEVNVGSTNIYVGDVTATDDGNANVTLTSSGGGGTVTLQSKTKTYTPSETEQTETVTADSGYDGLSSVGVTVEAVSSTYVGSGITQRSSTDLVAGGATVTAPAGYYASNASKSIANGVATAPSAISSTEASITTGTNTLTFSKTISVTPEVSAGFIASGTSKNTAVSLTATVPTLSAQNIYPSTSDQTITSGQFLSGAQVVKAVTTSNLTAENIKSGVVVTVGDSSDADRILSVTGTYSGGGSAYGYTLLGSTTLSANTTSTSNASLGNVTISSAWTSAKIIYVRVRDTAGKRAGYFYGSDVFFINPNPKIGSTSAFTYGARAMIRYTSSSQYAVYSGTGYGVFGYDINTSGRVRIYTRYSSSYSLTINGSYKCEVYALDFPDGVSPFV